MNRTPSFHILKDESNRKRILKSKKVKKEKKEKKEKANKQQLSVCERVFVSSLREISKENKEKTRWQKNNNNRTMSRDWRRCAP